MSGNGPAVAGGEPVSIIQIISILTIPTTVGRNCEVLTYLLYGVAAGTMTGSKRGVHPDVGITLTISILTLVFG